MWAKGGGDGWVVCVYVESVRGWVLGGSFVVVWGCWVYRVRVR